MAIRNFSGKVAVITGGGSGIGQALARELARKGCDLALVDVRREGMLETRRSLDEYGVNVSTHVADVSSETAMQGLPAQVLDQHGRINLLFNNAGITLARTFEGHSLKDWERMIGINLWGVIYGCHFFLPHLREQAGEAHIVNLSSMVAFMGPPGQSSYAATKSAIKGLSESLWAELRGEGIGVTVVHPGAIRTAIMQSALERAEDRGAFARTKAAVDMVAMAPEKAARIILKAVRRNRMRVVVGPDALFFDSAKRAMPEQIHRLFVVPGVGR
jgi:short-subunit dehydrogenase